MCRVVLDAELVLDDFAHPGTGPQFAAKSKAFCTAFQQLWKPFPVALAQTQGGPGFGLLPQRCFAALLATLDPLADRAFGHAQGFGDILLHPACLVQSPGSLATFRFPIG